MSRFHKKAGYRGRNVTKMRALVWTTYPHVCHLCRRPIPTFDAMEVDHLIPISRRC